jgi:Spy/CpxP family protein refolding chaperone
MKTFTTILMTAALAASLAFAQRPGGPPDPAARVQHRVSFLTTLLTLTTAQQQQATAIFTTAASAEAAVHGSFKTAHQGLADAIKANNSANIDQISTTIGNLTAQMASNHAKAEAAFYQILTPDQQTKLAQYESQNHGHGQWGMGPGPMHGGPR